MSALDFSIHGMIDNGGGVMIPQLGRDDQSYVEFFKGSRLSKAQSDAAGSPVYVPIDMVRVIQPGERDVNCQEANGLHKRRWPKQWEAYQKGVSQLDSGTPLDNVFPSSPDMVNTLKAAHIYNAEQLAGLSDTAMNMLPMGRTLAQKAKAYLDHAKGGSEFHQMQKQMADMAEQLKAAQETIAKLSEPVRRGPGRPPKDTADDDAMRDLNESRSASRRKED